MKKLTKFIINERISHRDIEMIGDYNNSQTKTTFQCLKGHIWEAVPNNIINGRGCPECKNSVVGVGNNARLSKEIVNSRIIDRGIVMVSDYHGSDKPGIFRCHLNHEWETTVDSVIRGKSNCPHCDGQAKLSREEVNKRLAESGRDDIIMIDVYTKRRTLSLFKCINGHELRLFPSSVLGGQRCRTCYTRGFTTAKPVWIYIIDFGGYIKYGVTNDLQKRLSSHKKLNGEHTLIASKLFEDGTQGIIWEKLIKTIFGGNYVSKDICPNGYTETLSRDRLGDLLKTIS
jgi:hypothetical protein